MRILSFFLFRLFFIINIHCTSTQRLSKDSELFTEENILSVTKESSISILVAQGNRTAKIYRDLRTGAIDLNISNVFDLLHSHLITMKRVYDVFKDLTLETSAEMSQNSGLRWTNGICLCSNAKFSSEFQISEEGFEKLEVFVAALKTGVEAMNASIITDLKLFLSKYNMLLLYYLSFAAALENFVGPTIQIEVIESHSHMDLQYKIFLQHKFSCFINSFLNLLSHLIICFKNNGIHINSLDREMMHAVSPINPHVDELEITEKQHIQNSIDIYYMLVEVYVPMNAHFICFGAFLNLKMEYAKLIHLIKDEKNNFKPLLDETLIDEFRQFVATKDLGSLDNLYEEYLVKRCNILEALNEKIHDNLSDDKNLKDFFLSKIDLSLDRLQESEISKYLKWNYNVIFFVQHYVLGAKKTNFNIFLGFACIELDSWIVSIHDFDFIESLSDLRMKWLKDDNSDKENKQVLEMIVNDNLKGFSEVKKLINFIRRGWFGEKNKDTDASSVTEGNLENELLEYMKTVNKLL